MELRCRSRLVRRFWYHLLVPVQTLGRARRGAQRDRRRPLRGEALKLIFARYTSSLFFLHLGVFRISLLFTTL